MWALHNAFKNWTLYGLNEREVQLLLNSLVATEFKFISICNLNEKKWEQFDNIKHAQFIANTGQAKNHFPEMSIETYQNTQADYFIVKPKKIILPRLYDRIDIEIPASIEGHNQNFTSLTVDLSEGGIYFKDIIPDWVSGYFIVQVNHLQQSHQIMCALVEDQKIKHRVQVMSEDSETHYISYKNFLDQIRKIK